WPAGERIVVASENCAEYVDLLFGIWGSGAVAVPVNFKLHAREMAQITQDAGACCVIASPTLAPGLEAALADLPAPPPVVTIGSPAYAALLAGPPDLATDTAPDAPAWLFYPS